MAVNIIDEGTKIITDGHKYKIKTIGIQGPTGPPGPVSVGLVFTELTRSEYDALDPPDPDTLYFVIED